MINNGDTAFIAAAAPDAAGLVLGQTGGSFGGLEVRSGDSINFVESTGAPDGSIVVGLGGQGALAILPGGSATGTSLAVNSQSSLTIGGPGAASLAIGGPINLNGTSRVIGPGHTFSGSSVSLGGSSTLIAELTSSNHSPIRTSGTATVAGTLRPELGGGFMPSPGDAWNLIDALTIFGGFANIDLSAVPLPAPGTAYRVASVAGGVHGRLLQLQFDAMLQLTVNADTGGVSLSSPSGVPIEIVGYSILSASGSLDGGQWNSLQQQLGGGWEEAAPRPTL